MSDLRVVPFTGGNLHDIPAALRSLADLIEHGEDVPGITDATHLVWITVCGGGMPEVGTIGPSADKDKTIGIATRAILKLSGD